MAYEFKYAPTWAEGVTDEELLEEINRRLGYYLHGWQESYTTAQRLERDQKPQESKE